MNVLFTGVFFYKMPELQYIGVGYWSSLVI